MANWQRKLDLYDVWQQAQAGELPMNKLAAVIADRLEALKPLATVEAERQQLIEDFRMMADDDDLDVREFGYHMAALYDWADTRLDSHWNGAKVCWVETNFKTTRGTVSESPQPVSEGRGA